MIVVIYSGNKLGAYDTFYHQTGSLQLKHMHYDLAEWKGGIILF